MNDYRIFISYSHKDIHIVEKIVNILKNNGLTPMWDKNFAFGYGFHEQIQSFIAHAHVFMPVITSASSRRGWVHQEIGYAMALNIPVLPVTLGQLPGEMIQQLQAVFLGADLENAENLLNREVFESLIDNYSSASKALYQCAGLSEDRAILMAQYANSIIKLRTYGHVRQKGGLSSFHIPDKVISDPVWKMRYNGRTVSEYHCKCQFEERQALEKHASVAGCSLIINPKVITDNFDKVAQKARFNTFIDFLNNMPDEKVMVAINNEMQMEESITMVGDWFAAEAVSRSITQGYRQTIFTRHAPGMNKRVEMFDRELEELIRKSGWTPETSKHRAIETLSDIMS